MTRWQPRSGADDPTPHVTVDRDRGAVVVRTASGADVVVDMSAHRADVVRRLLELGVSVRTLKSILPQWCSLISRVAGGDCGRLSDG